MRCNSAAIGSFYSSCRYIFLTAIYLLPFTTLFPETSFFVNRCVSLLTCVRDNAVFIKFYIQGFFTFILLLSGDIEVNPGPIINNVPDILHLNVRSIRNKIAHLNSIVHDFDILCFTETHLDSNVSNDNLTLDGFSTIFRKDGVL